MTSEPAPADLFKRHLVTLIKDNFVTEDDIVETRRLTETYGVQLNVEWRFFPYVHEELRAGNPGLDGYQHFGDDAAAYARALETQRARAHDDRDTQSRFLRGMQAQGNGALQHVCDEEIEVAHHGYFSHHVSCKGCKATGNVDCRPCGGNGSISCPACGGQHGRYEQRPRHFVDGRGNSQVVYEPVWVSCMHCDLSGRIGCGHCRHTGQVDCSDCEGHGFFTRLAQTAMRARPYPTLDVHAGLAHDKLRAFLEAVGYAQYPRYMTTVGNDLEDVQAGSLRGMVRYRFQATVTELALNVRQRSCSFTCLGSSGDCLIHGDLIFDWLFGDTLARWAAIRTGGEKKVIKAAELRPLFDELQKAAVSRAALDLLSADENQQSAARDLQYRLCCGLMSAQCAQQLIDVVGRSLSMLSPRQSESAWAYSMMLPWLLSFVLAHMALESVWRWKEFAFAATAVLIFTLLATCVGGLLAHPLSYWLCREQQAAIPERFRRKPTFWAPFKDSLKTSYRLAVAGCASGLLFNYLGMDAMSQFVEWLLVPHLPS